jgi:hypothetical protein
LQNVPELIYKNSGWFFFLSNELEMDRIRAETAAAARRAMVGSQQMQRMQGVMANKLRLPTRR